MIYGEDGAFFVGLKGGLEKAVAAVVQDVVHINIKVEGFTVVHRDFAGVGGVAFFGARVFFGDKIEQGEAKGQFAADGAVGEGKIQVAEADAFGLVPGSFGAEEFYAAGFFPCGYIHYQGVLSGGFVAGSFYYVKTALHGGFGKDKLHAGKGVEGAQAKGLQAVFGNGASKPVCHLHKSSFKRGLEGKEAVGNGEVNGAGGGLIEGEEQVVNIGDFAVFQVMVVAGTVGGFYQLQVGLAGRICYKGLFSAFYKAGIGNGEGLSVEVGPPGKAGVLGFGGYHYGVLQGFAAGLAIEVAVHPNGEVRLFGEEGVGGFAFAYGHDAFVAEVAGNEGAEEDEDKGEVEEEDSPFFAPVQPVTGNVAAEIEGEQEHDGFEPTGVVNPDTGGFGAVAAFYKGAYCHGGGEGDEEKGGETGGKEYFCECVHGCLLNNRVQK